MFYDFTITSDVLCGCCSVCLVSSILAFPGNRRSIPTKCIFKPKGIVIRYHRGSYISSSPKFLLHLALFSCTTMTIILTPYLVNGVQRLRVAPQRLPLLFSSLPRFLIRHTASKPKHGLLPPAFEESSHVLRCLEQLRSKDQNIEKYIYLSSLKECNPQMFYKLCLENMSEFTPIIYTPTVGDACLQYSHIYRRPEGLVRV